MRDGLLVAMSPRISIKTANIVTPINLIVVNDTHNPRGPKT